MVGPNQLRARVAPSHSEYISKHAERQGFDDRTDAEREIFRAGLEALGYIDQPSGGVELFCWYLRRIGLTLGTVGLIMIGYGVFGPRLWPIIGLSLLMGGFLFIALGEGLDAFTERRDAAAERTATVEDAHA